MPTDLAALLVAEGAVSPDALARAVERQREAGGSLDTALLEERAVAEDVLVEYLSRAAGLPAAPASAWEASDARARRVFPSRVAERHGLAPFALDGRELALVATHPVELALLDEIGFMLSLHLVPHVAPEWRVRTLIHRLYGGPLAPRFAALAGVDAALLARADDAGDAHVAGGEAGAVEAPQPEDPAPPSPSGFSRDAEEPLEPLAAALQQALEADAAAVLDELLPGGAGERHEAQDPAPGSPLAGADEPEREAEPAPDRSAPPRWSLDEARAALARARDRDEVVLVALRHARDYFEYAAVFAVARDAVAGHDALGAEDERERARSIAIWASDPGVFRTVLETKSPYLGPADRTAAGTQAILEGLGREAARTVLAFPVLVRDRPVCVLYADNGGAPVSVRRLGDLLLFLAGVGPALERIIHARKERRRPEARAPAPPEPAATAPAPPEPRSPRAPERAPSVEAWAEPAPAWPEGFHPVEAPGLADRLEAIEAGDPIEALEVEIDLGALDAPAPPPPGSPDRAPPAGAVAMPLPALADRALDADEAIAGEAREALAALRRTPGIRQANDRLRRALLSGISARSRRAARALGAVRDADAIPLLIQALETSDPDTAAEAADALAAVTLQRLGPDARRWLAWWKENRGRGRAEWLFAGLTSPDRETRVAASAELSTAAPPPVVYSADLPAADREQAARAWAVWWARSGLVL